MPVLQLGNALSVVTQYIYCFGLGYPMKGRRVVGSSIEEGGCRRRLPVYFGLHSGCTNRTLLQKLQEPAPPMRKEANMARILSHIVTEIDHPLRGRISRVESGSH